MTDGEKKRTARETRSVSKKDRKRAFGRRGERRFLGGGSEEVVEAVRNQSIRGAFETEQEP